MRNQLVLPVARGVSSLLTFIILRQLYAFGYEEFAVYSAVAGVVGSMLQPLAGYWVARGRGNSYIHAFLADLALSGVFYVPVAVYAYQLSPMVGVGIIVGWIAYAFVEPLYYAVYTVKPVALWAFYLSKPLVLLPLLFLHIPWLLPTVSLVAATLAFWYVAGKPLPRGDEPLDLKKVLQGIPGVAGGVIVGTAFNEALRLGFVGRARLGIALTVDNIVMAARAAGETIYSKIVGGGDARSDYWFAAALVAGAGALAPLFTYILYASTGRLEAIPDIKLLYAWSLASVAGGLTRMLGMYRRGLDEKWGQLIVSGVDLAYALTMLGVGILNPTIPAFVITRVITATVSSTIYVGFSKIKFVIPVYVAASIALVLIFL